MIDALLARLRFGSTLLMGRSSLIVAFALVAIIPIVFLYSGQQFLEAGKANQDKIQRDKLGLLHDSLVVLLQHSKYDIAVMQTSIEEIQKYNRDIETLRIVEQKAQTFTILAATNLEEVGQIDERTTLYQNAAVRFDESLIYPYVENTVRYWQAVRAIQAPQGSFYYIYTNQSLASADNYFAQNERSAYWLLGFIYAAMVLLALWQIKQVDYLQKYTALEKTLVTRDQFMNSVVHELRTPLTAMRGYASLIEESTDVSEVTRGQANKINLASQRSLALISDLLDVARLQSGKLAMVLTTVNLHQTIEAVIAELTPLAAERNLVLTSTSAPVINVTADQKRLQQILINLVTNALKYTKEGGVTIEVAAQPQQVLVRIKDTGVGIDAENQAKLFAPFFRVENTDTTTITGTGLGMWITKELIVQMGATVAVESIKGVGTHVILRLPVAAAV